MIALLRADELDMAEVLEEAQMKYNGQVSIGSYPILGNRLVSQYIANVMILYAV